MPQGDPGNPPDKPGLELFKGEDALDHLVRRVDKLKQQDPSWEFEFVLAKYHED